MLAARWRSYSTTLMFVRMNHICLSLKSQGSKSKAGESISCSTAICVGCANEGRVPNSFYAKSLQHMAGQMINWMTCSIPRSIPPLQRFNALTMAIGKFRIWRGDANGGSFHEHTTECSEGMV